MDQQLAPTKPIPAAHVVAYPASYASGVQALNHNNMNIRGDKVHLEALLDHTGLEALEKKIAALKVLLEVTALANDTGEHDDDAS